MSSLTFDKELLGLLVVDPYNDSISEGGKVWGRVKEVAEAVNCVPNAIVSTEELVSQLTSQLGATVAQ